MRIMDWNLLKNEKSLKMQRDVEMAHKQGRIKVMVSIQSLSLHLYSFVKRYRDGWGFVYSLSLLSFLVCALFGTPFLHLMIFLSCFCTFLLIFSLTLWSKQYFNQVQPQPWNSTASWVIVQPNMQPHTGSLHPRSLVAYNAGLIHLAFMPQTSIFERLEYIFLYN